MLYDITTGGAAVVRHVRDGDRGRFEVTEGGVTATLDYHPEGRLVLGRTHVPMPLDEPGHRIAGQLLRAAIDRAKADHLILVPACPFARRWFRDNSEAVSDVVIDWSSSTLIG